jgi:hypothetical protein
MAKLAPEAQLYQRVEDNAFHLPSRDYFLGVEAGDAIPPAAPSSIPKVQ